MPFEIDLGQRPAGYAAESVRANEQGRVQCIGLVTTEDGRELIKKLEGWPTLLLNKITTPIRPSAIDQMLAVFRPNGKVTLYVNELIGEGLVRARSPVAAGQPVRADDIVEFHALNFGVDIPNDCGVLFLTSVGWRKALYYDFSVSSEEPRTYDLARVFGQVHGFLVFQERLRITDDEWGTLFAKGWFPFIGLAGKTVESLLQYIRDGWDPNELSDTIAAEVTRSVAVWCDAWQGHPAFRGHMALLRRAAECFIAGDYICATALLYPRIEGILRAVTAGAPTQRRLSESAAEVNDYADLSPMLPARFREYVRSVYFRSFDPSLPEHEVSRHTVSHGVASESAFTKKAACQGLLIVQQLFFSLESEASEVCHKIPPSQSPSGER